MGHRIKVHLVPHRISRRLVVASERPLVAVCLVSSSSSSSRRREPLARRRILVVSDKRRIQEVSVSSRARAPLVNRRMPVALAKPKVPLVKQLGVVHLVNSKALEASAKRLVSLGSKIEPPVRLVKLLAVHSASPQLALEAKLSVALE